MPWIQIQRALPGDGTLERAGLRDPALTNTFPEARGGRAGLQFWPVKLNKGFCSAFFPAQWLAPVQLDALCTLQMKLRGLRGS